MHRPKGHQPDPRRGRPTPQRWSSPTRLHRTPRGSVVGVSTAPDSSVASSAAQKSCELIKVRPPSRSGNCRIPLGAGGNARSTSGSRRRRPAAKATLTTLTTVGIRPVRVAPREAQQVRAIDGEELPGDQNAGARIVDVEAQPPADAGLDGDGDARGRGADTSTPPTTPDRAIRRTPLLARRA